MPSINLEFLHQLKSDYKEYPVFLETGTWVGDTIFSMEPHFNKLYTIEIAEHYYNSTKSKYFGDKINFMLGDGYKVISELVKEIKDPIIFFLDGHHSGGDTGLGEKECPLYEEIEVINNLFEGEGIIIIDDYRLFQDSGSSVPGETGAMAVDKTTVLSLIQSRITEVYHLPSYLSIDDRLVIHISAR